MIRILHCADLHIDSAFSNCGVKEAAQRRRELISAFSQAVENARHLGVRLFLIAGDLFESAHTSFETVATIAREIASLPECKFVIAPGNHDPYYKGGAYDLKVWPDNAFIFKTNTLSHFSFDDIGVDVYGYAFTGKAMRECPVDEVRLNAPDRINVLVAHGDTEDPLSDYCPLPKKLLETLPFDYIALGHIHGGNTSYAGEKYAYSGCLLGRALDETGYKGYIAGELSKESRNMRFVPLSKKRFEICSLDVTGLSTAEEILAGIEGKLSEYGEETTLRVILKGSLASSAGSFDEIKRKAGARFDRLEIKNEAASELRKEDFSDEMTIKGAAFKKLLPLLQSADKAEREKARLALRYVTNALSGNNDFS